jgi:hypothetical protein
MSRLFPSLRRVLRLACTCALLLVPRAASAEPAVYADFDGDGRHDRVTLDRNEPDVLRVWFSRTGTTDVIRSRWPLLRVIATDLDGDRRPELVANDASTGLHVWKIDSRNRFRSYHPKRALAKTATGSSRTAFDDDAVDRDDPLPPFQHGQELSGARAPLLAPVTESQIRALQSDRAPLPAHRVTPSAPRAPPTAIA